MGHRKFIADVSATYHLLLCVGEVKIKIRPLVAILIPLSLTEIHKCKGKDANDINIVIKIILQNEEGYRDGRL